MTAEPERAGPQVLPDGSVLFRLLDPDRSYGRVRLVAGLGTLDPRPDLEWADGVWSARVNLPPVHRLEYGFEITQVIADPQVAQAVDTGFGHRSVLELPGYSPPGWLSREVTAGTEVPVAVEIPGVTALLWSPAGLDPDEAAPLLLVHDGPSYAGPGSLTRYLSVLAADGGPTARALLVTADSRELLYGACDGYADAVVETLLPAASAIVATGPVLGVGASLGALAALHLEWRHPGTLAGMLLQSGAFFTPETDPQERGFPSWEHVTALVAEVVSDQRAAALPPVAITCGAHEENAANNALLAARLREVGVEVTHAEVADMHNVTCWRDSLDPALRDLLATVAG